MAEFTVNIPRLQQMQDDFSRITDLVIRCHDESLKELTNPSGDVRWSNKVLAAISDSDSTRLMKDVRDSRIEDVLVMDSADGKVIMAVIGIKYDGKCVFLFSLYGILKGNASAEICVDRDKFMAAVRLVKNTAQRIVVAEKEKASVSLIAEEKRAEAENLQVEFERIKALTSAVSYFTSDETIDKVIDNILKMAGQILKLSNIFVIRKNDDSWGDVAGEYVAPDSKHFFESRFNVKVPEFVKLADGFVFASASGSVSNTLKDSMYRYGIEALVMVPIEINGRNAFTACFMECRQLRDFPEEDLEFIKALTGLLQDIIENRIKGNSLEHTGAFLESVLDNITCSVAVFLKNPMEVLYSNELMKQVCGEKVEEIVEIISKHEDFVEGGSLSFEYMNNSYTADIRTIRWIDNRRAYLATISR